MGLLSLLFVVLILCLVYWAVHRLAAAFGLPAQIVVVIDVLLVIIAVLWIAQWLGVMPSLRLR